MAKRRWFIHMVKRDVLLHSQAQVHGEVTSTPLTRIYWCGKIEHFVREEPSPPFTEEEEVRHRRLMHRMTINPPTPCPKCEKKKREAKEIA